MSFYIPGFQRSSHAPSLCGDCSGRGSIIVTQLLQVKIVQLVKPAKSKSSKSAASTLPEACSLSSCAKEQVQPERTRPFAGLTRCLGSKSFRLSTFQALLAHAGKKPLSKCRSR